MENAFPLLQADEIECRTQSVSEHNGKIEAVILLYITARAAMDRLDARFGMTGWQRHNREIKGNLFCEISVWDSDKGCWVGKEDVGTESNMEAVKGEASDAFKRAAVNWGIGRELYTSPPIKIPLNAAEYRQKGNGKYDCFAKFNVGEIAYTEEGKISKLVLSKWGDVRYTFELGKRPAVAEQKAPERASEPATQSVCSICGKPITDAEKKYSLSKFNKATCRICQAKLRG